MSRILTFDSKLDLNQWTPLMFGASWFNHGQCYEQGFNIVSSELFELSGFIQRTQAVSNMQSEISCGMRLDGIQINYQYSNQLGLINWEGHEFLRSKQSHQTKFYQSSHWINSRLSSFDFGNKYLDFDLCPDVSYWVANAYSTTTQEEELFFVCTKGTILLNQVASYYNLPIPYGNQHIDILDNNPKLYRIGHFDIFKLGPGRFYPLVLASVSFIDKKPIRLLFHTFQRPWEFEENLDINYF